MNAVVFPTIVPKASRKFRFTYSEFFLLIFVIIWAVLLYNTPKVISVTIQIGILLLFFRSKTNHYWIALYMCAVFNPGGLFHNLAPVPLSLFDSPGLGTVTFNMGFTAVAILKAIQIKGRAYYETLIYVFGVYILLLYAIFRGPLQPFVRGMLTYSWLITLPKLISSEDDLYGLFRLIFAMNIMVLGMNLYQIVTGLPFVHVLGGKSFATQIDTGFRYLFNQRNTDELVRTGYGIEFAYLAMGGALLYVSKAHSRFPQTMLYMFLIIAFMNIFFSATRGWILGALFLVVGYSMFLLPKLFKNFFIIVPSIGLVIIALMQISIVSMQFSRAYDRFQTTEAVLSGDLTAGGTSGRVDAGKIVLSKYRESPLLGWGFGTEGAPYANGHTGHQTMLLQFGAIGYAIYILFWLTYMFRPTQLFRKLNPSGTVRSELMLPFFVFGGLIIIHSTSAMFLHPFVAGTLVATILAMGNIIYTQTYSELVTS